MGFKHVGKSVIGSALADQLKRPFIDLDHAIERVFQARFAKQLTCRQIMQQQGEIFFSDLEQHTLRDALQTPAAVIALGGGTLMNTPNQLLVKTAQLIHLTAPRAQVFERIMQTGRPAFFDEASTPFENFNRLWAAREKVYHSLSNDTVVNDSSIASTVEKIANLLQTLP